MKTEETITCKCGHTGTLRAFTAFTPRGVFHCPACKLRWKRVLAQDRVVLRDYIPWPWTGPKDRP